MRILVIARRADGRFVTNLVNSADNPLGVDLNLPKAVGTALREAKRIGKEERVPVAIDIEGPTGRVHRDQIVRRPVQLRRQKPAKPRE